MTTLRKFDDHYASIKVATYQPLIVEWLSGLGLGTLLGALSARFPKNASAGRRTLFGGGAVPTIFRYDWARLPTPILDAAVSKAIAAEILGTAGNSPAANAVMTANLRHAPLMARAGGGADDATARRQRGQAVRVSFAKAAVCDLDPKARQQGIARVLRALKEIAVKPQAVVATLDKHQIPHLLWGEVVRELSPVGVAHFYRQLYYDLDAGVGPIEQVLSVAPTAEVEVVQETTRRRVFASPEEFGTETTRENSEEARNLDELTDQVSSAINRNMTVAMSADVGGTVGVYNVGAAMNASLGASYQQSKSQVVKASREVTRKSAETIRKSYKLTVRTVEEMTERSTVRRTIGNDGDAPVNYGLRRVLRKIRVRVQSLGPRLVWQVYVCNPGDGLAQSRFLMFSEAEPLAIPDLPPGAPPRPEGTLESGSQQVDFDVWRYPLDNRLYYVFDLRIATDKFRDVRSVVIESLSDPNPGKNAVAPTVAPTVYVQDPDGPPADGVTVFRFSVAPGTAYGAVVNYTIRCDPSADALAAWQDEVDALRATLEREQREAEFAKLKKAITAKSRVAPRPAADLRKEERYELMNRMVGELFGAGGSSGRPSPLEIELFHRYFEEIGIFYYTHPWWWRPRAGGLARPAYEITEDSEPAALGKSLGWTIQMDGDRRRNEFLNSPWVRVCVPVRAGMERHAIAWLACHLEGEVGYDTAAGTALGDLIADIEGQRLQEGLAATGPDYLFLDGTDAPDRAEAADAFPVVDEFEVVIPTEGFAYDRIDIADD